METPLLLTAHLSLRETAVMKTIKDSPPISIAAIATQTGLSKRIVDRAIASLKEKAILSRIEAKNNATWVINKSES
ncbi:MAG: HTH domain-containing protein [Muribaculaceae bacterium]|nr:HTH domain-containing protein [Muribaculaceae bacterium]